MSFDWADDKQSMIKLTIEAVTHRENRGTKPSIYSPKTFIYESPFPEFATEVHSHSVTCQDPDFYSDVIKDGHARVEYSNDGRLLIAPVNSQDKPYFEVPPGRRYTVITNATTYVGLIGHFPLVTARPTLKITLRFGGSALPNLYFAIMSTSVGAVSTVMRGSGKELSAKGDIQIGTVSVTGQAILLSWKGDST